MDIRPLPLAALAAAAVLSTMAVADAIWNAHMPGELGPWVDAEGHEMLARALSLAHSGVYALFAAALLSTRRLIDRGRGLPRTFVWILIVGYAVFALAFAWLGIVDPHRQPEGILAGVVNVAFLVTLVAPIALGIILVRRRELRAAVVLLISPLLILPATIVLGALTRWGHPAYVESAVGFGVALLCVLASASTVPAARAGSSSDDEADLAVVTDRPGS